MLRNKRKIVAAGISALIALVVLALLSQWLYGLALYLGSLISAGWTQANGWLDQSLASLKVWHLIIILIIMNVLSGSRTRK